LVVIAQIHRVHELRLAGQVQIRSARRRAGGDQRLTVHDVRAHGADNDSCRFGEVPQCDPISGIRRDQRQTGQIRVERGEAATNGFQLGEAASGYRPAKTRRGMPSEILRGEPAGESGRTHQNDVVYAVGHLATLIAEAVGGGLRCPRMRLDAQLVEYGEPALDHDRMEARVAR
jgi:hypothetical protein